MRHWLQRVGIHTVFITPGSPWENGSRENVNGALRDDRLDRELFDTLWEMLVLIKRCDRTITGFARIVHRATIPRKGSG